MPHPPNFLFITTDQQRWDTLRCAGNPAIRTPHLDALAARGVRFSRAYPSTPICMPARASMIHRPQPARAPGLRNTKSTSARTSPSSATPCTKSATPPPFLEKPHFKVWEIEDSLPEHPPAGAAVDPSDGLWHGPYYGFDHVTHYTGHRKPRRSLARLARTRTSGEHPPLGTRGLTQTTGAPRRLAQRHSEGTPPHPLLGRPTDRLARLGRPGRRQPALLRLALLSPTPTAPSAPPAPYSDMYDPADMPLPVPADDDFDLKPPHYRWSVDGKHSWYGGGIFRGTVRRQPAPGPGLYYGMITFIDDMIGRVLQALERHGLAANTHFIFTSDHGEMIDDHGQGGKPPMTYESVIRVPFPLGRTRGPPTAASTTAR